MTYEDLNAAQKSALSRIHNDKDFQTILVELRRPPPTRYKPGKPRTEQDENWIYQSGRSDENDYILNFLKGEL